MTLTMRVTMKLTALCIALLPFLSLSSHGQTITPQTLLARGELRAEVVLETPAPLLQRAPLVLAVEVATPRWFSRGTRVADFRVPGAVVRPVSSFADNQTRRIDGASWTVQRWRYRIYAQNAGPLQLPPLRVFVSVNTETDGSIEGEIELSAPTLDIVAPAAADLPENWLAAENLQIVETWAGQMDEYRPGDALTRTRRYRVEATPAMMIAGETPPAIPGLSLYAAPAEVRDRSNRGQLIGERIERLVVTIEAPGDYELPGLEYVWFNLGSGEFETVVIEPFRFSVSGISVADTGRDDSSEPDREPVLSLPLLLGTLCAVALLLLTAWLLARSKRLQVPLRRALHRLQSLRKRRTYLHRVRAGDAEAALQLLDWAMHAGPRLALREAVAGDDRDRATLELLLACAYGNGDELPDAGAAASLWYAITRNRPRTNRPPSLALNPGRAR